MVIEIKDYFRPVKSGISGNDKIILMNLRNQINSYPTVGEQYGFIHEWRSDSENREFDYRVLGFPRNSRIYNPFNYEQNRANEYYMNRCNEIEIESEAESSKRKKNKIKAIFILISIIISIITGLIKMVNKYGGVLGLKYVFRHTPFGICSIDLNDSGISFSKSLIDDKGVERFIPGNPFEYSGYDQQHEDIVAGEIPKYDPNTGELIEGYKIFRSEDWGGIKEQRGVGTFGLLGASNEQKYANIDPQNDYVIVMRWEYNGFYIKEPNYYDSDPKPGRGTYQDKVDLATNCPTGPEVIDQEYKDWISQQKIIVFNPSNNKSVICTIGDGVNDVFWGSDNSQRCGLLTEAAIRDLEYDTTSDVELDCYFVPPEWGEVNAGVIEDQINLVSNDCKLMNSASGRTGNPAVGGPGANSGPGGTGDGGMGDGWVSKPDKDDWMNTITESYKELLIKYGFWPDKTTCTACATYVSIYLCEKYGDIKPTAGTSNLMAQLNNNPNYINLGLYSNGTDIQRETIFIMTPGTNGYKSGHTYMYFGDDVTGVPGKPCISASMNDHGPIIKKLDSRAKYQTMFVHK